MRNYTLPDQRTSAAESGVPEPLHVRPLILTGATETLALRMFFYLHGHFLHTSLISFKHLHPFNYHSSGQYLPSCLLSKTRHFGDRILSLEPTQLGQIEKEYIYLLDPNE
jgi:hypothetical protein